MVQTRIEERMEAHEQELSKIPAGGETHDDFAKHGRPTGSSRENSPDGNDIHGNDGEGTSTSKW